MTSCNVNGASIPSHSGFILFPIPSSRNKKISAASHRKTTADIYWTHFPNNDLGRNSSLLVDVDQGIRSATTAFIFSSVCRNAFSATDLLPIPPTALLSLAISVNLPL